MIRERLDPEIQVVDAYPAFVNGAQQREDNGLGEFFIARAGGAVDWDHPNRAGHLAIAKFLVERDFCRLGSPTTP
jgi:hypothetical protein